MTKFSEHANFNKLGIIRLDKLGAYAVIANKNRYEQGRVAKFAVVNVSEEWVDSVHSNRDEAFNTTLNLYIQ